jgi:hypothetical protein
VAQIDPAPTDYAEQQLLIRGRTEEMVKQLTGRKGVKRLISGGKVLGPKWWLSQRGRFWVFIVLLVGCAGGALFYQRWLRGQSSPNTLPNGAQLATALIVAVASAFAYFQWTDSRREGSFDQFYDRLALVNERYYDWEDARGIVPHFWGSLKEADFQKRMYVYLELDNLEYILYRYQLGFVTKSLLRRAIRTFCSRCQSPEFLDLAQLLVNGAGYHAETGQVVKMAAASADTSA